MLGESASSGLSALNHPAASLTTIPLDSAIQHHDLIHCLHWRKADSAIIISAPRRRHLLRAAGGVLLTCGTLAFAVFRLANLPVARGTADRIGLLMMLVLPCAFGLAGLFALLPVICPARLRLDGTGATVRLPTGFCLCRRHLAPGTFEIRVHEWCRTAMGPGRMATLFLRDRQNHATYPVFHKYPASELAEIMRSISGGLTTVGRLA